MRWMRWPVLSLIIILLPIWLLLLIPKINGFGPTTFKHELKEQHAYEQLSTILHQANTQPEAGEAEVADQAFLVLRSALTPSYIETKSNLLIDDSTLWLTNQTESPPELDFNDIKNQVLIAYPDAQLQINQLQQDLAKAQQELQNNPMPVDGIEGLDSDGSASKDEVAKLLQNTNSLNNFIDGDFRVNLGTTLKPLYDAYQYYNITIPVLGAVIALLVVLFIFSNRGWQAKLKNAGWLVIAAAIVNGVLSIIFSVVVLRIGLDMITGMLPSQAEVAGSIGQAVIQALFANYIQLELMISAALLVIGIVLVVASIIMGKRSAASSNLEQTKADIEPKITSGRSNPATPPST